MSAPPTTSPRRPAAAVGGVTRAGGLAELVAALLAYGGLTALFLRPFGRLWRDHLTPDLGDPLFNLYVLAWVERQARLGFPDLLGANFYFPTADPLALSDHLVGFALQVLALRPLLGDGPTAGYNLLLFLSFALSATAAAAMARAYGCSRLGAFVAGLVYGFAPYRWGQLSHLQVLTTQWIPLALWSFDRLLAAPRAATAAAFLASFALHLGGGAYLAAMIHLPLLVLLLHGAAREGGWRRFATARRLRVLVPAGAAALALSALAFLPYVLAAGHGTLARGAENYRFYGATLPSLLTPSPWNRHFDAMRGILEPLAPGLPGHLWFAEKSLFPGLLPCLLLAAGVAPLILGWRRRSAGRTPRAALLAVVAAAAIFVAADLYTLGWWGTRPPGTVYTVLGAALAAALALAVAVTVLSARGRRHAAAAGPVSPPAPPERGLLAAGATALLLAFPVVYEPLSELLPGLSAMRVPARFYPFALVAVALLCARGADRLAAPLGRPARAAAAGVLVALLAWELAPRELPWHRVPPRDELPAVYHWLAGRDDVAALLELPLLQGAESAPAMYAATLHWKPIVNGFSGHQPASDELLRRHCCWPLPDDRALALLRDWGVSHVVVHPVWRGRWRHRAFRDWLRAAESGVIPGVRPVFRDPATGDTVFDIRLQGRTRPPPGPPPAR